MQPTPSTAYCMELTRKIPDGPRARAAASNRIYLNKLLACFRKRLDSSQNHSTNCFYTPPDNTRKTHVFAGKKTSFHLNDQS